MEESVESVWFVRIKEGYAFFKEYTFFLLLLLHIFLAWENQVSKRAWIPNRNLLGLDRPIKKL